MRYIGMNQKKMPIKVNLFSANACSMLKDEFKRDRIAISPDSKEFEKIDVKEVSEFYLRHTLFIPRTGTGPTPAPRRELPKDQNSCRSPTRRNVRHSATL